MAKTITVTKKTGEDLIITVQDEIVVPPIPPSNAFKDHLIPGRIQFEDFDLGGQGKGYNDTTAANQGGTYRTTESVDIEGNKNIAYTAAGEWLNYTLKQVTAGKYNLSAYVASVTTVGRFTVSLDGKVIGTFSVPNTGAWTSYKAVTVTVDVPAGAKLLRVDIQEGQWNGDYLEFTPFNQPPVPPTTGGISSGFKEAIETAAPGNTVLFAKGTYPIGQINVPLGVNVDLGDSTLIGTVAGGFNQDKPMFRLNGRNKFGNGSGDGKNIISSFVTASGDEVYIDKVSWQNCNWLGMWGNGLRNSKISNFKLRNTSGATVSWAAGELCFSNLNNVEITNGDISSDNKNKGYGMKAMYQDSTLSNVRISNVKIDMHADSVWANGTSKNIGLEVHQTRVNGLEVYNCDFRNQMSLSYQYQGAKTIVRNNVFDLSKSTYVFEHILDNFEFYDNVCRNWQIISANFVEQPYRWNNTIIRNNQFLAPVGIPVWGGAYSGAFLIGHAGVTNYNVRDNVIEIKRGQKPYLIKYNRVQGGVNIEASNTIREV